MAKGIIMGGGGGGSLDPTGSEQVPIYVDSEGEVQPCTGIDLPTTTKIIKLPASGWSTSAPYQQTVYVTSSNISLTYLPTDVPVIGAYLPESIADAKSVYNYYEQYGFIGRVNTVNGGITAVCYGDKPTMDIYLQAKGQ